MALLISRNGQSRVLGQQLARRREHESRCRQQWERHAQYLRQQSVQSQWQTDWSSRHSQWQSKSAYETQRLKEHKKEKLEQRRNKLRLILEEEKKQLEVELKLVLPDRSSLASRLVEKTEELRSAREERQSNLAKKLLKEHWKKNRPELREVKPKLHKNHVASCWQEQISEKKPMEELRLRENEATHLKQVQVALMDQQRELEKIVKERRTVVEKQKKSELRLFLTRHYRAQLKRRAQQVQEELENDHRVMSSLLDVEDEEGTETACKERAVADATWIKCMIEEQLQLEREREADFERLYREDAQRVWEKREAQWKRERQARERLMQEMLAGRQQRLETKMQKNREAQEESLRRREELIQELEEEGEDRGWEREQDKSQRVAGTQETNAQVEQQHHNRWEELGCLEQEEEKDTEANPIQDSELEQRQQLLARDGHQENIINRSRSAWT